MLGITPGKERGMNASNFRGVPAGELCDLDAGNGITVELFRSVGYTGPREDLQGFRPCAVKKNKEAVWDFRSSGANPKNGDFAELYDIDGELVIAVQNRVQIFSIIPVNDFVNGKMVMFKGTQAFIGGSSSEKTARLKDTITKMMKGASAKMHNEKKSAAAIVQNRQEQEVARKRREKILEEKREAEAKRQADMRAREERRMKIQSRDRVEAWSATGQHFFGTPVEGVEWQSLQNGAYAIEMKNGQPVRAFTVQKDGARASKIRETEVSGVKPEAKKVDKTSSTSPMHEAVGQITAELKGKSQMAFVFDNMEHLKLLRGSGLNGGTWVGYQKPGSKEVQVYEFHGEGDTSEFNSIGVVRF